MTFPLPIIDSENTENEFFVEHEGIFFAESPFLEFSRLSGYQDLQNIKSDRTNAFGVHLSIPFAHAAIYSENTENDSFLEHEGIFCAESSFPKLSQLLGYCDLQSIKSDRNNAFGVHLSMHFHPLNFDSQYTENDFFMEHEGIFCALSPFREFNPLSGYRDLQNLKLDRTNAFGVHLSVPFPHADVYSENTEKEFFR